MEAAKKIQFNGQKQQVTTVIKLLEDEIALFRHRIDVLNRATIEGQDSLISTYKEMINVREEIMHRLKEIN